MEHPLAINKFLSSSVGHAYFDDCISEELKITPRQTVNRITTTLATTSDFQRQRGECFRCKNDKLVISRR